jgi:hypothetical protein
MLVEDISSSQGLRHDEGQQVTQPELVVDEGVGGDGVLAAKVQQEETAPGQNATRPAADGKVAQSVHRRGVRRQVRQPEPEEELQSGGAFSPAIIAIFSLFPACNDSVYKHAF